METTIIGSIGVMGLCWGYVGVLLGLYYWLLGFCGDNGKENGHYYSRLCACRV